MKPQVYPEDIECLFPGTDELGSIFVSNIEAAQNLSTLAKHQIRAVVTVARGGFLTHEEAELPNYLYIPAEDVPDFQLAPYFTKAFEFIDRNLQRTNVLVHCMAGISRSVTIVISFLMRKFQRPFMDVFIQLRRIRPIINPNYGFVSQLKDFELTLRKPRDAPPKKQRKMSDVILEQRRSMSSTKPLTPLNVRVKPSWQNVQAEEVKNPEKPMSPQKSEKIRRSEQKEVTRGRSLSQFQKPRNPEPPKRLERMQKPSEPIIPNEAIKPPQKSSIESMAMDKTLMSKLLSSNTTASRLKQTTKYDSYKFKNSENLRDNIIKYYKAQGLGL